jgi:acetyltransferase-like isoleucine patch superfamily enzyme
MQGVRIYETAKIVFPENVSFGDPVLIDDFCFISAKSRIAFGSFVHIGCHCSISASAEVVMEDFSGLSHGCRLFTATEDFHGAGFGNPTVPLEFRNVSSAPIRIGRFAVVGANSVIMPGVTIGEGATVGACSVVTKDLEPWGVYVQSRRVAVRDQAAVLANHARLMEQLRG